MKGSRFAVRIGLFSFPFGSFLLSFVSSFRCWSSPAKLKRKFWKLCDNAGVKCRLNACLHVKTLRIYEAGLAMEHFQLNSFEAQSFLPSVFNALNRGSFFRIGLNLIIQTCVITWIFKFFGPIQLIWFSLGWVAVLIGLFFLLMLEMLNAVQKPLTKVLSPRRLELRTRCVWGTRDNHYTMVTLWNFSRLSSVVDCATCL